MKSERKQNKFSKMSFSLKWFKNYLPLFSQVRFGHRLRGKPPGVAKSLAQRLGKEI